MSCEPAWGRRGPEELRRRFDGAVSEPNRSATGTDLLHVADTYEEPASVAGELASAVEAEDRASGLLPRVLRRQDARSLAVGARLLRFTGDRRLAARLKECGQSGPRRRCRPTR